jgi:hypothetical protein
MKFNLKNRPIRAEFETEQQWLLALDLWFMGFEKELRQKLLEATKEWNELGLIGADLRRDLLKEIVGEDKE